MGFCIAVAISAGHGIVFIFLYGARLCFYG